ncbi:MAG TPA: hypothetical protein VK541_01140 [Pedobacter sp.]|uniref:COG1470 family protein n=1 Tax=Pedobacter sp. TaxID=1411316 RepID=UPI002CF1167F|nr:hypothetical protein [Pedobacter sp.]HMI01051.1 hypothetical protein [Pedobacter sp.]
MKAQTSIGISYGFKLDTVAVNSGETFTNVLWIENTSNSPVTLVQSELQKIGLLKLPDSITIGAGQKKWFPLKYMADRLTIHKNLQDIYIQLKDSRNKITVQPSASFYAQLENIQSLVIDTDQQEVYLNQVTNQARVMVRIFNNGLIPINFRLELVEIPDGLDFIGERTSMTIEPGSQETIPFIAKNKLNNRTPADFAVTIRALDVSGNVITLKRLRIMSVSSDRRLSLNQTPFYQNRPNTVALRYMSVDNSLSMYQFQGNGKYDLANDHHLNYQLNVDYFNNPNQKGVNIYDSFIDYSHKGVGIKAGNIYESLDFNLNGRGVKGTVNIDDKRSLSVYGIENDYLLFSDFNSASQGNTFAVSFKENNAVSDNKSLVLLHNSNLLTKSNTTLLSGTNNISLDDRQNIGLEAGYSVQDLKGNDSQPKNGGAFGVNYNLNGKRFNFYSNNYYSTPYYGGLRKGLLQLENKALMNLGQYENISARFNLMNNKPKELSSLNNSLLPVTNNYGNTTYELGYGNRIGQWSINIRPYYFGQHMEAPASDTWRSSSIRSKFNINYNNANHDFSFEADNGYTFQNTSQIPPAPFFSSRMTANYRNRILGFTGFAQFNSYYLSDALAVSSNPKYYIYSFGPNTSFALLKQSVVVNANAMYNYFGFNRSENYSFTSNVRWRIKGDWTLSADIFYGLNMRKAANEYNPAVGPETQLSNTRENVYRFDNKQFRIGIEKRFGGNDKNGDKKMELIYFEDLNGNGYRDNSEPFAPDILVKVEGLAAITNSKGAVVFTGAQNKLYAVSIVNNKNWSLEQTTEVYLNKNVKLEIPLVKTERLTGRLAYIADKYNDGAPSIAGLRIKAIAENGKTFSTLTNEDGMFNFYLPESKYIVSVDTEGMPYSILNPNESVEVKRSQVTDLEFKYKYTQRKVEVTKFN